jgi:hypothetical protein
MRRTAALVLAAFLLGSLVGATVGATAVPTVYLQPGQQVIVVAVTPKPTASPTIKPTASPTVKPTASPTTSASQTCPAMLQAAVDALSTGATLNVTGCGPYHEIVTITKPMTLVGASVTGGTASLQHGNIEVASTHDVTIDHATVTNSTGACIAALHSTNVTVKNSLMSNCTQEGYKFAWDDGVTFTGNRVTGNNAANSVDTGWEAGAGKADWASTNLTFTNNEIDHNVGNAMWFDGNTSNVTVSGNRVHDNTGIGIFYETGTTARITGNFVWSNGFGDAGWVWGSGILVSASATTEVDNNIVAWNADGIGVMGHTRDDMPAPPTGLYVHDNVIVLGKAGGTDDNVLLGWVQDTPGVLFDAASNNRGANNRYWDQRAEPEWARFGWNGWIGTLALFNGTPGEEGGTYLTTAELAALLAAGGLPTAP